MRVIHLLTMFALHFGVVQCAVSSTKIKVICAQALSCHVSDVKSF